MPADPYKYFRVEARELLDGLTRGALELEKGAGDKSLVGSLLRLAHTLKGASRVVQQPAIAELAHGLEEILSPFRDAVPIPQQPGREMLRALNQISAGLAALDAPSAAQTAKPHCPAIEENADTVRVEVEEVEALLGSLSQGMVHMSGVGSQAETIRRTRRLAALVAQEMRLQAPSLNGSGRKVQAVADELLACLDRLDHGMRSGVDRVQRQLAQCWEYAGRLRLLPSGTIFPSLARTVRDASVSVGKNVEFESSGADIRIDAQVLGSLREPLSHLVRNAVAHGIEAPQIRAAAGKPPGGRVELLIERRGHRVAFICRDDGMGIDVGAIRRAAVKKGLLQPAEAESLDSKHAIDLILRGGISTTSSVTGISGRGIGLDIARAAAARLKGEISIETRPGRGTSVEICVPVSLTSTLALTVECGGVRASIPADGVLRTLRLNASDVVESAGSQSILFAGRTIPFLPLSVALGGKAAAHAGRWSIVIVAHGDRRGAVGVDKLVRVSPVLVHSLPPAAGPSPVIAGAILDAVGIPQAFLDPVGLVDAAAARQAQPQAAPAHNPPILVIDDSLTTRMVEQSILETAGHQVELATSAEEAMEMARARPYSLFLVDVEMPGMDGFEFVSRTRADPVLRDIPAILVTSRNSPEDRRRGEEAGARSYMVKSEFDQSRLLETIDRLVSSHA